MIRASKCLDDVRDILGTVHCFSANIFAGKTAAPRPAISSYLDVRSTVDRSHFADTHPVLRPPGLTADIADDGVDARLRASGDDRTAAANAGDEQIPKAIGLYDNHAKLC